MSPNLHAAAVLVLVVAAVLAYMVWRARNRDER
jgi:heme/copper-type cytochrome/quinol oxidase subunit 2